MMANEPLTEVRDGKKKERSDRMAEARIRALLCAGEADRFKALDIVLLEVGEISSFADYFLICSGKSSRQVQGIADNMEAALAEHGFKPLGIEGRSEGQWVLMDYGDVIVHVFYEPVRSFYDLESLWADAKRVVWEKETVPARGLDTIEGDV